MANTQLEGKTNLKNIEEFTRLLDVLGNGEFKRLLKKEGNILVEYYLALRETWLKSSKKNEDLQKVQLAALVRVKRNRLKFTHEELAAKLDISPAALKKIEYAKASVNSVRKKKDLRTRICSVLEIEPRGLNRILQIESKKVDNAFTLEKAKNAFGDALQNSDNYQEFFINVFKITQDFKVSFQEEKTRKEFRKDKLSTDKIIQKQYTDQQLEKHLEYERRNEEFIDQVLNEVSLMSNVGKLKRAKYAQFFLDLIFDNAETKNETELAAKHFFSSKILPDCSDAGLKKALSAADKEMQIKIYKILLKKDDDGKFGDVRY